MPVDFKAGAFGNNSGADYTQSVSTADTLDRCASHAREFRDARGAEGRRAL